MKYSKNNWTAQRTKLNLETDEDSDKTDEKTHCMHQWHIYIYIYDRSLRLRSSSLTAVDVPVTRRSTIGDRAFQVAAARAWNSLPSFVTSASLIDWLIEQCFTSPPTQYRLYGRQFLQVKRPNQQYQSTEGGTCKGKNPKKQRKHKLHMHNTHKIGQIQHTSITQQVP